MSYSFACGSLVLGFIAVACSSSSSPPSATSSGGAADAGAAGVDGAASDAAVSCTGLAPYAFSVPASGVVPDPGPPCSTLSAPCHVPVRLEATGCVSTSRELLPAGPCDQPEGTTCGSDASLVPAGGAQACNVSVMRCICSQGAWSCAVISEGAGACICPSQLDAGGD